MATSQTTGAPTRALLAPASPRRLVAAGSIRPSGAEVVVDLRVEAGLDADPVGLNPTGRPRRSSAGTRRRLARRAGRLAEQAHQLDPADAAFAALAPGHPTTTPTPLTDEQLYTRGGTALLRALRDAYAAAVPHQHDEAATQTVRDAITAIDQALAARGAGVAR